jgi:hypothetical protein
LLISRRRYYSYRLGEVTTCSRLWTYRLVHLQHIQDDRDAERLVHIQHIQDLQE